MKIETLQLIGGNHIGCAIKADGKLRFVYSTEVMGPPSILEERERFLAETINKFLEELRQENKKAGVMENIHNRYRVALTVEEYEKFISEERK